MLFSRYVKRSWNGTLPPFGALGEAWHGELALPFDGDVLSWVVARRDVCLGGLVCTVDASGFQGEFARRGKGVCHRICGVDKNCAKVVAEGQEARQSMQVHRPGKCAKVWNAVHILTLIKMTPGLRPAWPIVENKHFGNVFQHNERDGLQKLW